MFVIVRPIVSVSAAIVHARREAELKLRSSAAGDKVSARLRYCQDKIGSNDGQPYQQPYRSISLQSFLYR